MKLNIFFLRLLIFFLCSQAFTVYAKMDALSSIKKHTQNFQERYGISLIYENVKILGGNINLKPVVFQEYGLLNDYLALFEKEINKYPPEFFKNKEIRAIVLVTHLFFNKQPAQGAYSSDSRAMIFDISRFSGNQALTRHSIHHELFHMMAFQTPGYIMDDPTWARLNPASFTYGKKNELRENVNPVNPQAPGELGFVTDYAMTSVEEDKAEVFACLMQNVHRELINRWAKKDGTLRQKIQAVKDFVVKYCPQMNEKYWETI